MSAVQAIALAGAGVTGALALLHLFWAAGGRLGMTAAVPSNSEGRPLFRPGRAATAAVAAALAAVSWLFACTAGLISGPPARWAGAALGVAATIFVLRAIGDFRHLGFFKRRAETRFARLDTLIFSPLCLFLGLGGWAVTAAAYG